MSNSNLNYYTPVEKKNNALDVNKDLIIYGSTPAGISAAVQARRYGLTVAIAEFNKAHFGGMITGGLSATDFGAEEAVGGLAREFYRDLGKYYNIEEETRFEPKAAKKIYADWLTNNDIEIYFSQHLDEVYINNGKIEKIVMEDGSCYNGKMFIDASYEGDLLAKAGISYKVGRESNSTYHEIYNGIQFGSLHHKFEEWIDPYVVEGNKDSGLLKGVIEGTPDTIGVNGQGDNRIQAYNFRITLSKDPKNQVSFPKPNNYDSSRYLLLLRYLHKNNWDAMKLNTPLPNNKSDLNNHGAFSTDNIGMNYEWPEASYEKREEIYQDHVTYDQGLLYFLAYDKRVPKDIQNEVSKWGLPKDEFEETNHWSPQLYIREARRILSDYVMTDRNCRGQEKVIDSIGLASYHMDSHNCRRLVIDGRVLNEGDVEIPVSPFSISYRSIRPKKEQCTNLLVPVCLSASHIAYGSIRMEPIFMITGQSAAVAAMLALKNETSVQDVNYNELKEKLLEVGQILEWDDSKNDDPFARMEETFGK